MDRSLRSLLLCGLVVAGLLGAGSTPAARADQEDPVPQQQGEDEVVRELKRRVLLEGGHVAEQAAFKLFSMGRRDYDEFLAETLATDDTPHREARLAILRALRHCGLYRPEAACELVYEALDDTVPAVASQAVDTFVTIEDDLGRTYAYIRNALLASIWARPATPRGKKGMALVEVLERMRNQIEATGVLVAVLEYRPSRALQQKVRETLQRMTARAFDGAGEWRAWFDEVRERCGGSLAKWRSEVARQQSELLSRYEAEAERFFLRLLTKLKDDPEALFQELTSALGADTVPAVRRRAIQWLGSLAADGSARAVNLLKARIEGAATDYDEVVAQAIQELGGATDPGLYGVISPFLDKRYHPGMRGAAVAALGRLGAAEGVDALLALLADTSNPDELLEAVIDSLGRLGRNPEGRVASALTRFASGHLGSTGLNGGAASATQLLKVTAEALSRLPCEAGAPTTAEVAELLTRLAGDGQEEANVRLYAVTALGRLPHPAAFPVLTERLSKERVLRVRKALLDGISQQALDHPELEEEAIRQLVPFLDDPEESLRRRSRQQLDPLVAPARDADLANRSLLVRSLLELRPETGEGLALTFLAQLPSPAELATLPPDVQARALGLLEVRAKGRLATDRPAALLDLRALIASGRPLAAFHLALGCFPLAGEALTADALAAVWDVALDAVEAVQLKDRTAAGPLLDALAGHAATAPEQSRLRYEDLKDGT